MYRLEFYKAYSFAAYKLGMASTEYALFTIIYSYYENGGECFYSLKGWADMIYVSTSTIQRAIKNLKKKGIIRVGACNYTDSLQYYINESVVEMWKQDYYNNQLTEIKQDTYKELQIENKASAVSDLEMLIYDYGKEAVEKYAERVNQWYKEHGRKLDDEVKVIRDWIEKNKVPKINHDIEKYNCCINMFPTDFNDDL